MSLAGWIKEQGRALGFQRVGIAPASDLPELAFLPEWQKRGYAGALDYMQNPKRRDVRELLPEARSVICCALAYDTNHPRSTEVAADPGRGWISRYAWGDDYHELVTKKLETLRARIAEHVGTGPALSKRSEDPALSAGSGSEGPALSEVEGFEAKLYVDTGPVLERVYGKYAGLGWQAKNTCLLDAELGSFFFLGVLVTNLALEPDAPLPDGCGACTLCLEACPTGAIVEPYVLDARRCISYLTIELREAIPEEFRPAMGQHVFGCDICQDVCPYNRRAWLTDAAAFAPRQIEIRAPQACAQGAPASGGHPPRAEKTKVENRHPPSPAAPLSPAEPRDAAGKESLFHPRLDWLASLSEEGFREVFRASAVRRTKWRGLLRNVLVAMGNSGLRRFRPLLEKLAAGEDTLLAEHARWALERLSNR